jgi:hypothetical protein
VSAPAATKVWYTYHFDTDMNCPNRCGPGAHPLYVGMSCRPWVRVLQHAQTQPWWGHQTGYQVHPGTHGSQDDAEAFEYQQIRGLLPLANRRHNEDNPCRYDFGPAARTGRVVASRGRAHRPVWRRRGFWVTVLAVVWLAATVGLWWYAGHRGWPGLGWSAVTVTGSSVWIYRKSQRRKARRRKRRG